MDVTTKPVSIAVVGSGYVGLVAAVCFAEIGHSVVCVDNDEQKVAMLREGDVPIHEEFLPELLARHRNKRLRVHHGSASAAQHAEAIFIAVGTPQSDSGNADLSYVDAVATQIARSIGSYKVIVEKSTVPVYTNEWIRRVVERNGTSSTNFDVASNPEFLREGTAVSDFLHPDRIVVGADSEPAADVLKAIYAPLTSGEYYRSERRRHRTTHHLRSASAAADLHQGGGVDQACVERLPGDEDFVHQRRGECVRGGGRERGRGGARHGTGQAHRQPVSDAQVSATAARVFPRTWPPSAMSRNS